VAFAAHARGQAPVVPRRSARRRAVRDRAHAGARRLAGPVVVVVHRGRHRDAAARALRAPGPSPDRAVGTDHAPGTEDQHRRHRACVRGSRPQLDRSQETAAAPLVRLDHDPRPARQGFAGRRLPAVWRHVCQGGRRPAPDCLGPGRGRVADLLHQGCEVRTPSYAPRARRGPAVWARRPHAAAGLQAAVHLAQGPVRARPVRPQGRDLPDVDIAADRRPAAPRQDVRRPADRALRRARSLRRHHSHRREVQQGLAAAAVRRPPAHPGHPPDQGRRPGPACSRRAVRDRPPHRARQRGTRQAARGRMPRGKLTEKLYRRPDLHVQLVLLEEF